MDVLIRTERKDVVFEDAAFSVGLSILVDRITAAGAIVKVTEYYPTGDLWVFRMVPNAEGTMIRNNIEIFPTGTWKGAKVMEPQKKKANRQSVH